ncbi:MAG: hypothetical protein ACKVG0_10035, partial [Alphaproteobacteria bacterium]
MSARAKGKASGLDARRASLNILSSVLRKNRAFDVAFAEVFSKINLDERDLGFARAIASETLRRFGTLDAPNRLAQEDNKAVHFKPLINAVLRRITREGEAVLESLDSTKNAMPDWMWERLSAHYGEPMARAIAEAHLNRPPLDLVFGRDDDPLLNSLNGERIAPRRLRLPEAGKVFAFEGYQEGRWGVQDFA